MLDKELIRKVKAGDRKAFNQLCAEAYPGLLSYARIFLSDDWADDVVQDVFFSVWQKRHQLREEFNIHSYLYRSVHNCALNYLKLQQHSKDFSEWNYGRIAAMTLSAADIEKNSALNKLYSGDLRKQINAAIDALPPRQREIFNLSYVEELTSKEIALRLGLSPRTVESHIYEALKKLRKQLSAEHFSLLVGFSILSEILEKFH